VCFAEERADGRESDVCMLAGPPRHLAVQGKLDQVRGDESDRSYSLLGTYQIQVENSKEAEEAIKAPDQDAGPDVPLCSGECEYDTGNGGQLDLPRSGAPNVEITSSKVHPE
jgi:hypothetical protein